MKLSDVVDLQIHKIYQIQRSLKDIGNAFPGWDTHVSPIEGLLTCGIENLRDVRERMLNNDNTIAVRREF